MVTSCKGLMQYFLLAFVLSHVSADDAVQRLPFCDPSYDDLRTYYDLFLVSSLDGRLSAFSASEGVKLWELETESLLSSNVHHIELTSEGNWARLVPSLRGSLYRLTGESLEALPLDAEQLLSSSFKYSDDLVIAGARETVWRGLEVSSGRIIYECNSRGCNKEQRSKTETVGEILVLRQNSYTIRALDPRTGYEKWNFSVAEHHLSQSDSAECNNEVVDRETKDVEMNVVLPDGIICAHPTEQPLEIVWKQKLEAPVAAAWRLKGRALKQLNVLSLGSLPIVPHDNDHQTPALYIGLHNHQLYIQESQHLEDDSAVVKKSSRTTHAIAWRPKPARLQIETSQVNSALEVVSERDLALIALHTLYSKSQKVNHGYFLYEATMDTTCDQSNVSQESLDEGDTSDVHHVHVHVYSLWFWWKEVLLIAISSALLMNLMIWPRIVAARARPSTPVQLNQEYIVVERHIEQPPMVKMLEAGKSDVYNSRYLADFTPLRCLGRGGFGVVFEAKNNIDDCSYAVKRITLPKRQSKRERVLREVRALAKLEHDHIVRYFNAWLEEPPLHWQEQQDALWIKDLDGISALVTSEKRHSGSSHVTMNVNNELREKKCTLINLERPNWDKSLDECFDALDYNSLDQSKEDNKISKRSRSFSCNDSFSIVFDEHAPDDPSKINCSSNNDSFIVFEENYDKEVKFRNNGKCHQAGGINSALKSMSKAETDYHHKTKKSHRRVCSLDLSVKSSSTSLSKMYLYIQMQLCQRDSLHDWLRHNSSHEARKHQVIYLFSQIVSAVEHVHFAGLIHRDLKPSNIFFAPDGKIKIGDFGLVTAMSDQSTDSEGDGKHRHEKDRGDIRHTYKVGTHLYMSPEQLHGHPYSYKVDIYSLGLILFELLQPFNTESERINSLLKLREGEYPYMFQDKFAKESESLKLMLSNDPTHRPTACGVKSRAPLCQPCDPQWHFKMPPSPLSS